MIVLHSITVLSACDYSLSAILSLFVLFNFVRCPCNVFDMTLCHTGIVISDSRVTKQFIIWK